MIPTKKSTRATSGPNDLAFDGNDHASFPDLNDLSQASKFSRLGLPSDEAMDEFEHMRTSTVPSDGLTNTALRSEMDGFMLSDNMEGSIIPSSPPMQASHNNYGELPPHPSSIQGEILDDVLPSSMFPMEDSDSQKTRRARNLSEELPVLKLTGQNSLEKIETLEQPHDDNISVFVLSSTGESEDDGEYKRPKSVQMEFDSLPRRPSSTASKYGGSRRPSLSLDKIDDKITIADLVKTAIENNSAKITQPSTSNSKSIPSSTSKSKKTINNAASKPKPPTSPRKTNIKACTQSPGKNQPLNAFKVNKRRRKQANPKIPPFPEMESDSDRPGVFEKEVANPATKDQPIFARDESELSEPKVPTLSRRPSSVRVDEDGSPIPVFPENTGSTVAEIFQNKEIKHQQDAKKQQLPVRRSTRIKRTSAKAAAALSPSAKITKPSKSPPKQKSPQHTDKAALSGILRDETPLIAYPEAKQKEYIVSTSSYDTQQTSPQVNTEYETTKHMAGNLVEMDTSPDHQRNDHKLKPASEIPEAFALRPAGKYRISIPSYIPDGLVQGQEPLDLREEITRQIKQREEQKRQGLRLNETDHGGDEQEDSAQPCIKRQASGDQQSPLVNALTQTTCNILKYVHGQEGIMNKVINEYRQNTTMLVQKTRELHLKEAEEFRLRLEDNHEAFLTMCNSKLKMIQQSKKETLEQQSQSVQNMQTSFDNLNSVMHRAVKAIKKLEGSLGDSGNEGKVDIEDIKRGVSNIIDEVE
ncbi:hypothetical protein Cpir12675_002168 [Ceratocystis pirilliformis]|uniref:Uncharacterized protein n=1 Tax=Ceratocystis pirilliformis TaxID=259994 RepID=A0ABR3ZDE3_9PEZI